LKRQRTNQEKEEGGGERRVASSEWRGASGEGAPQIGASKKSQLRSNDGR
jgi:hypothetical protein